MQTIVINNTTRKLTPLLMKHELVSQTFKGVKNQTRRLNGLEEINQNPDKWNYDHQIIHGFVFETKSQSIEYDMIVIKSPFGKVGDIIWVRENFKYIQPYGSESLNYFFKDGTVGESAIGPDDYKINDYDKWRPSIHMPAKACRLFLEIVDVRPERLHNITDEDAISEGISSWYSHLFQETRYKDYSNTKSEWRSPIVSFYSLWNSINGNPKKQMYEDKNPWVWRIEYKVIDKPDGWK